MFNIRIKEAHTPSKLYNKLMRSNQPQAKFRFKSDSNHPLIDFFDPKSLPDLIEIVAMIRIGTRI